MPRCADKERLVDADAVADVGGAGIRVLRGVDALDFFASDAFVDMKFAIEPVAARPDVAYPFALAAVDLETITPRHDDVYEIVEPGNLFPERAVQAPERQGFHSATGSLVDHAHLARVAR